MQQETTEATKTIHPPGAPQERGLGEPSYFGDCPRCGRNDGYVNDGDAHLFTCDQHRVRWLGGFNCFSSWKDESKEVWDKNCAVVMPYTPVREWRRWLQLWRRDIPLTLRLRNLVNRYTWLYVWQLRLRHRLRWHRPTAVAVSDDVPF